jgi:hypothetical protein
MANTKRDTNLPAGHVRMKIELTIEGEAEDAGRKLAAILKTLPRETQLEALGQIEQRANQAKTKEA